MNTRTFSASSLSLHAKLFMAAMLCAVAFAVVPAQAQASGLTTPQIEAVLGLLAAFDVPQETISNVRSILYAESAVELPAPVQAKSQTQPIALAPAHPSAPALSNKQGTPAPYYYYSATVSRQGGASKSASSEQSLMAAAAAVPFEMSAGSLNILADQVMEINSALVDVVLAYGAIFSLDAIPHAQAAAVATAPVAGNSVIATLAYLPESLYETAGNTTDFLAAVEMAPLYVITDALSETLFKAGLY